jgi:hypothetical protein
LIFALKSESAAGAYYLGRLFLKEGNYDRAIDRRNKAVGLDRKSSSTPPSFWKNRYNKTLKKFLQHFLSKK